MIDGLDAVGACLMNDRDECMHTVKMQFAGLISSWTVVRNPFASMKSLVSGPETVKGAGG